MRPVQSPSAVIIPALFPDDILCAATYRISGPGASVSKIDAIVNVSKFESSTGIENIYIV